MALACASALWSCDSQDTASTQTSVGDSVGEQGTAEELPQEELAAIYAGLTGLVAEARTEDVWKRFGAEGASMSISDNRLIVNASGDEANLRLPAFAAGKQFILQVIIDSPVETVAQLFYLVKGQTKYREGQSQVAPLTVGRNVIYFRVDPPDVIDPMRFDPSAAPGEYTIESMTAMGLPAIDNP